MRLPDVGAWSTPVKLIGFATAVVLLAAVAFGVGSSVDPIAAASGVSQEEGPEEDGEEAAGGGHGDMAAESEPSGESESGTESHGGSESEAGEGEAATAAVRGLAVTESGYSLSVATTSLPVGTAAPFTFTVTGPDGAPVTDYDLTHEKELHLILVHRDLTEFQHVHPERAADGSWSIPVTLPKAGSYRVFADFAPTALDGETLTLGSDIDAAGRFESSPLPAPSRTAAVGGLEVTLAGETHAGEETELTFSFARDGEPVDDLDPYLGAFGHLVSLRVGDLAYLHTHPTEEAAAGTTGGPEVVFGTTFPSAGTYRLFLDFSVDGEVRTAPFTVEVS